MAKGSILVTGSNGGLGSAILERIILRPSVAQDYYGLYAVRKAETADDAKKALRGAAKAKHQYELVSIDLSSLDSVRKTAADINERVASGKLPPIRALILSAAYQEHFSHSFTKDGFDMTFQATYLSHFLLTLLLLQSMDKEKGRIVILGSWTHDTTDLKNQSGPYAETYIPEEFHQIFTDPEGSTEPIAKGTWGAANGEKEDRLAGMRRYGAAKLSQVMTLKELARRIPKDPALSNIVTLGVDPGGMSSPLSRRASWFLRNIALPIVGAIIAPILTWLYPNGSLRTTWKSAGDVVRAAFDSDGDLAHPNGLYINGTEPIETSPEANDEKKTLRLWRDSLVYANVKEGDTVLADWK
ncbi:NAD(P)-binding protein [Annulohypoxylon maeteangense]|uniref:NAD(P)-binding protein n=1 Tax=Annulohypoxylon maeteangense TaxID=1927788 RepID=UPI0020080135|nr:NAD(P)-binding protein [Annulohypoxylon maeteangense]KAI0885105.1 NAD(P)-binding protein [Annulohypoxylon maeteangense]